MECVVMSSGAWIFFFGCQGLKNLKFRILINILYRNMYLCLFPHECIKVLSLQEQWEGRAPKHAYNCQILASICQVSLHTHSCCRLLHQRNRLLHSHYGTEYFYLNWFTQWLRLWVMSQAETTFNLATHLRGKPSFFELRLLCFFGH